MKLKTILSFFFIWSFGTFVYGDLLDPRWQELVFFCKEMGQEVPFIFGFVVFLQSMFWLWWIAPLIALYLLMHIEISNCGRSIFIVLWFFVVSSSLEYCLADAGLFVSLVNGNKIYDTEIEIQIILCLLAIGVSGFIITHDKVWCWLQLPRRKIFWRLLKTQGFPKYENPFNFMIMAYVMFEISLRCFGSVAEQKAAHLGQISQGIHLEHVSFSDNISSEVRSNLGKRVIYSGQYLRHIYRQYSLPFVQIHIADVRFVEVESTLRELQIDGEVRYFSSLGDLIHKKIGQQKAFEFKTVINKDFDWQSSERFYLLFLHRLNLRVFTTTLSQREMENVATVKGPIKNVYSTRDDLYVFGKRLTKLQGNEITETATYDNFVVSKLSHDTIATKGKSLFYNREETTLVDSFDCLATSSLGSMILGQMGKELVLVYQFWQEDTVFYWDFPEKITNIVIDEYSYFAYMCTQNNDIYRLDLETMELLEILNLNFTVYDMQPTKASNYLFIVGDHKNIVIFDTSKGELFELEQQQQIIFDIDISLDGKYILYGGSNKTVHIFDISEWQEIAQYLLPDVVKSVAFCEYSEENFVVVLENGRVIKN